MNRTKCIVKGCDNHSDEGRFTGSLCNPCFDMLASGNISYTNSFLKDFKDLKAQNEQLRRLLKEVL